jgi:hypothetical protein
MDMKLFKQHLNHLTELNINNGGSGWNRQEVRNKLFKLLQGQGGGSSRPGSDSGEPKPPKPKNPKPKKPGRDN